MTDENPKYKYQPGRGSLTPSQEARVKDIVFNILDESKNETVCLRVMSDKDGRLRFCIPANIVKKLGLKEGDGILVKKAN